MSDQKDSSNNEAAKDWTSAATNEQFVQDLARRYKLGKLGGHDIMEKLASAAEPRKAITEFRHVIWLLFGFF